MEKSEEQASGSKVQVNVEKEAAREIEESPVSQSGDAEFVEISGMKIEMSSRTQRGVKYASTFAMDADVPLDSVLLLAGYLTVRKDMPQDTCRFFYDYLVEHSQSKTSGIVNILGLKDKYRITHGVRKHGPIPPSRGIDHDAEIVLKKAVELAKRISNRNRVGARHILLAMLSDQEPTPKVRKVLQELGYNIDDLRQALIGKFSNIETRKASPPSSQVKWLADEAAKQDRLNRGELVGALTKRLEQFYEDSEFKGMSFLIHIDGPWGSGKSTLMNLMKSQLNAGNGSEKWLFVPFDAWRQSHIGPPWWALLTQLRQSVAGKTWWKCVRLWCGELWRRIQCLGPRYMMAIVLTIMLCLIVFLYTIPDEFSWKALEENVGGLTAAVGIVASVWGVAILVSKFAFWYTAAGAKIFERSHENPMQAVAAHFAWLTNFSGKTPVFLIDDLDRCPSTYVVGLLDAIQTLIRKVDEQELNPTSCSAYFIVAADGRWIRQSYEIAYKDFINAVDEPGRPLGYLFLEKLFQLTIRVPSMDPELRDSFLKELLQVEDEKLPDEVEREVADLREKVIKSSSEEGAVKVVREAKPIVQYHVAAEVIKKLTSEKFQKTTEHRLQKFAPLLDPNPRSMKRFIMAYSISRAIFSSEGNWIEPDTLALWTILQLRWPELAERLRQMPEDIQLIGPKTSAAEDDRLRKVFLDHEVRRVINFAKGGPLTEDKIKECCVRGRGN